MSEETTTRKEFRVDQKELSTAIKEIFHEMKVRRLIIQNEKGKTVVNVSLLGAAIIAYAAPVLLVLGGAGFLTGRITIIVEGIAKTPEQ